MMKPVKIASIYLLLIASLCGCISPRSTQTTIVVKSVDDIPDISEEYAKPLSKLEKGMSIGQVNALFPNIERECYESGVCHFTVFDEKQIRLDVRLKDLDILTGSLFSLLALTCVLSKESCDSALAAAVNVGIASAIESGNISRDYTPHSLVALVNFINHGTLGIQGPLRSSDPKNITKQRLNDITLIQWINIELDQGKVTQWAVNEPLEQYKPKTYSNELPSLEEALGIKSGKDDTK